MSARSVTTASTLGSVNVESILENVRHIDDSITEFQNYNMLLSEYLEHAGKKMDKQKLQQFGMFVELLNRMKGVQDLESLRTVMKDFDQLQTEPEFQKFMKEFTRRNKTEWVTWVQTTGRSINYLASSSSEDDLANELVRLMTEHEKPPSMYFPPDSSASSSSATATTAGEQQENPYVNLLDRYLDARMAYNVAMRIMCAPHNFKRLVGNSETELQKVVDAHASINVLTDAQAAVVLDAFMEHTPGSVIMERLRQVSTSLQSVMQQNMQLFDTAGKVQVQSFARLPPSFIAAFRNETARSVKLAEVLNPTSEGLGTAAEDMFMSVLGSLKSTKQGEQTTAKFLMLMAMMCGVADVPTFASAAVFTAGDHALSRVRLAAAKLAVRMLRARVRLTDCIYKKHGCTLLPCVKLFLYHLREELDAQVKKVGNKNKKKFVEAMRDAVHGKSVFKDEKANKELLEKLERMMRVHFSTVLIRDDYNSFNIRIQTVVKTLVQRLMDYVNPHSNNQVTIIVEADGPYRQWRALLDKDSLKTVAVNMPDIFLPFFHTKNDLQPFLVRIREEDAFSSDDINQYSSDQGTLSPLGSSGSDDSS